MTAVTPKSILKVAMGFMAAKHLFVASEVGLFEALAAGPATIEELASQTGVPSRTIAIAAAAMVSLGLIEQDGDHYQNGEPAAPFPPANPVPIYDQCYASSIRSVIQHGKSLRTRCEQAMARRNSAHSISANRRFSRAAWSPSPARARPRWRQITTSAAIITFSMWPVAPARSSLWF